MDDNAIDAVSFSFDGLPDVEARIRDVLADAAYLVLLDRTDRTREERVGRLELDMPALAMGGEDMARVSRWLRDAAAAATMGDPRHKFRVRVYAAKGGHALYSGQFICKGDGPTDTVDSEEAAAPSGMAAVRTMAALGDCYAQFGRFLVTSVTELQKVNNGVVGQLAKRSNEDQQTIEALVAALAEKNATPQLPAPAPEATAAPEDVRNVLVRETVGQVGEIAKMYLGGQGLTPDLMALAGLVGAQPELKAALTDPAVVDVLRNPANGPIIAALLKQAASQMPKAPSAS